MEFVLLFIAEHSNNCYSSAKAIVHLSWEDPVYSCHNLASQAIVLSVVLAACCLDSIIQCEGGLCI